MKRGKDDEKIMEPMFPRLHVNDTEKGGPRAPPRNKMALYEQLSIPSQRFNRELLPPNPNNSAGVVPPASSSQGTGREGDMFSPLHLNRSTHPAGKLYAGYSNLNTPSIELEQNKKQDEEDFTVPIFVQSDIGQDYRKNSKGMDREKLFSFGPTYLGRSMKFQNTTDKEPKRTSNAGSGMRQEGKSQNEDPKEYMSVGEQSVKSCLISSASEKTQSPLKQTDAYADQEHRDRLVNNFDRLQSTGASLHRESSARSQLPNSIRGNYFSNEPVRGIENGDREDDASETSMVDSISCLDMSPDDVVGIIGQKHFWKARRAIVNQQRVFAVQVFELHRLIKVQRLIAGSPHLLLEDSAYLGKPLKGSSPKKLPIEYIVKPSPHIAKRKDDSKNPNSKMECSAENAVGKTSHSFEQNVSQPSNYRPFSEQNVSPWCFHQLPGQQWLVPVMSPSEGLIYKPYHPGHGLVGPVCGGCGLPGSNPMMGNFVNPAYGFFPSYGMPVTGSAVEQANQPGQLSGGEDNFNVQPQSSCNEPIQKNGAISNGVKLRVSKESELLGSTASSFGGRAQEFGTKKGRNVLPLFPTSPVVGVPEGSLPQLHNADRPTRVIKVVPRNARSATESVARIFQSIQEERKQCDSA